LWLTRLNFRVSQVTLIDNFIVEDKDVLN
jgi:hypothetical protein